MGKRLLTIISLLFPLTIAAFDHSYAVYGSLLKEYVINKGVLYNELKKTPAVIDNTKAFFESVSKKEFRQFSTEQQIAFLINAYNFYTLELIVNNLPLKNGIRDITSPWKQKFIKILDSNLSLDNIEHDILRKEYKEPRIHFALVCASISCPSLINKPFIAQNLSNMLDNVAKDFLLDETKNKIDKKTLYLSKIFDWYGSDFKVNYAEGYIGYIKEVLNLKEERYKIKFLDYNWNLNSMER
jgi:hypothetical protein